MQIIIRSVGIDLTEAINDYIEKKISGLDKFHDKILKAEVKVGKSVERQNKGEIFICECKLSIPKNNAFVSKTEKNLYKAIDKVRDHLEEVLKKAKVLSKEKIKKDKRQVRNSKELKI